MPGVWYVRVGLRCVDVPPSPIAQAQFDTSPVDWSVKLTVSGAGPLVFEPVNRASGGSAVGASTVMYEGRIVIVAPSGPATFRVTV